MLFDDHATIAYFWSSIISPTMPPFLLWYRVFEKFQPPHRPGETKQFQMHHPCAALKTKLLRLIVQAGKQQAPACQVGVLRRCCSKPTKPC